jgi:hypothetical protein
MPRIAIDLKLRGNEIAIEGSEKDTCVKFEYNINIYLAEFF